MISVKKIVVLSLFVFISFSSWAYLSGIAFQTDKRSSMQVYVNGKLYNKQPGNFVRIPSKPGLFHVQVKVLNPYDKQWYLLKKNLWVEKGYEFYYRIVFRKNSRPIIQAVKRYPVYSKYFLNPTLYNKHPVT
jgi:hypothetical protein